MKNLPLFILAMLAYNISFSQVRFPLHVGDSWGYMGSGICDNLSVSQIKGDTVINGKPYFYFSGYSVFGAVYSRSDSNRVFVYDTSSRKEYTVFDFNAKPGDTVSVFGSSVIVAAGPLQFVKYTSLVTGFIYTIQDNLGVVSISSLSSPCVTTLTTAVINGIKVYPAGISPNEPAVPAQSVLLFNYPNPFNPSTHIQYYLPADQHATLEVLNETGQCIETMISDNLHQGWHTQSWSPRSVSSGTYFIRLRTEHALKTIKVTFVK